MTDIDRRTFLAGLSAASGLTIVPRRVLGGQGYIAPSDMIRAGAGRLRHAGAAPGQHRLVSAPTSSSSPSSIRTATAQNYVDWSEWGNRNQIRRFLEDPHVGRGRQGHPRRPRRRPGDHGDLLPEAEPRRQASAPTRTIREMLEKETDIQGVINITPDHQHGQHQHRRAAQGQGGDLAQAGGERALRSAAHVAGGARELRRVAPARLQQQRPIGTRSPRGSTPASIGTVREVHNWTNRPFWPQGMQAYHASGPPVPDGFNWALWQGPEPDRPYHPSYTFAVYRGWYAYGTGCLGDMGHYSLWQPYRILNLGVPEWVEGRPNNEAWVNERNVSTGGRVSHGRPAAREQRPLAASRDGRRGRRSTRSGTTAA